LRTVDVVRLTNLEYSSFCIEKRGIKGQKFLECSPFCIEKREIKGQKFLFILGSSVILFIRELLNIPIYLMEE